jgi:hypothetical protein
MENLLIKLISLFKKERKISNRQKLKDQSKSKKVT